MGATDLNGFRRNKSSRSDGNSASIKVELAATTWRKSTRSNATSACVEVGLTLRAPTHTAVRDSKNPSGPTLIFPRRAFVDFLRSL
ncbi:DUF397 domain-containing protein [Actinoalloteichus hymeniacidonis]|uniref:DUF397 domain-containing protein n=1 Tax=Actinoalloteichus hymeniacidonis TaxID=340345 RepID=UPI000A046C3B|nr:DUF397 domain-containing protein [Actinoalloteichus hymeniacidonis]